MLVDLESEMLGSLGYQVTALASSTEALDVFRNCPQAFDLVITDQTMPRLTGVELARELIRIRSDIPIILCTGYSDRVTREGAFSIGIREFLLKPIRCADMARIVRDVLNRSHNKDSSLTASTSQ
jgi:CheY-like chemotaxis protein